MDLCWGFSCLGASGGFLVIWGFSSWCGVWFVWGGVLVSLVVRGFIVWWGCAVRLRLGVLGGYYLDVYVLWI